MNRRQVFERLLHGNTPEPLQTTSTLAPYKPGVKLSADDVHHLLWRTQLNQPSQSDIQAMTSATSEQAVAMLLAESALPTLPSWATINPVTEIFSDINARQAEYYRRYDEAKSWWYNLLRRQHLSMRETMTFFWHNHFCSDYLKVYYPQYMIVQNQTFRRLSTGNFKELTRAMVADPAMLIYLDNIASIKGKPNENFARELLELFTLGVGHYTDTDVVEAARALTGWRINGLKGEFKTDLWDFTDKSFLGESGKFNADDILDVIFSKDQMARFIVTKLYKFFVYEIPNDSIITELANEFKQTNFSIKAVLELLLSSEHFYDMTFRGARIKSPMEWMMGLDSVLFDGNTSVGTSYQLEIMQRQTMELLYPPTVEGWKGYHLWISSSTFPERQRVAQFMVEGQRLGGATLTTPPNIVTLFQRYVAPDKINNPHKLIDTITAELLSVEIGTITKAYLLDELLLGAPDYEWSITMQGVELRLRSLLKAIVSLPEYQLS